MKNDTMHPNGDHGYPLPTMPAQSAPQAKPHNQCGQQPGPKKGNLVDTAPLKHGSTELSGGESKLRNR